MMKPVSLTTTVMEAFCSAEKNYGSSSGEEVSEPDPWTSPSTRQGPDRGDPHPRPRELSHAAGESQRHHPGGEGSSRGEKNPGERRPTERCHCQLRPAEGQRPGLQRFRHHFWSGVSQTGRPPGDQGGGPRQPARPPTLRCEQKEDYLPDDEGGLCAEDGEGV